MKCFVNCNFSSSTICDFFTTITVRPFSTGSRSPCRANLPPPSATPTSSGNQRPPRPECNCRASAGPGPLRGRRRGGCPRAYWPSLEPRGCPGSRGGGPAPGGCRGTPPGSPGRGAGWPMCVRRCLAGLTFCTCYLASYLTNKVRGTGGGWQWLHVGGLGPQIVRGRDAASSCLSDFSWCWWRGSGLCMKSLFRNRIRWTVLALFPAL